MSLDKWKFEPKENPIAANDNNTDGLDIKDVAEMPGIEDALKRILVLSPDIRRSVMADVRYFAANQEEALDALKRAAEITEFIHSLGGYTPSENSINFSAEHIANDSLQETVQQILASDKAAWKTKPSYFLALASECFLRLNRLRSFLRKEE